MNGSLDVNLETLDAHTHPVFIPGKFELNHLVDACIKNGVSALGISDFTTPGKKFDTRFMNFADSPLPEGYKLEAKERQLFVVSRRRYLKSDLVVQFYHGQEVATKEGHVLLFDIPEQVLVEEKDHQIVSMGDTIKRARDQGATVIATHPHTMIWGGMGYSPLRGFKDEWDGLELNAQCMDLPPGFLKNYFLTGELPYRWELFAFIRHLYQEESNKKTEEFAKGAYRGHKKHRLIATSDMRMSSLLGIGGSAEQIGLGSINFKNPRGNGGIFNLREILNSGEYDVRIENVSRIEFLKRAIPNRLNALLERFGLPSGEQ